MEEDRGDEREDRGEETEDRGEETEDRGEDRGDESWILIIIIAGHGHDPVASSICPQADHQRPHANHPVLMLIINVLMLT